MTARKEKLVAFVIMLSIPLAPYAGMLANDFYTKYYCNLELTKSDVEWAQTKTKWRRDREQAEAGRKEFQLEMMNRGYDRMMQPGESVDWDNVPLRGDFR